MLTSSRQTVLISTCPPPFFRVFSASDRLGRLQSIWCPRIRSMSWRRA